MEILALKVQVPDSDRRKAGQKLIFSKSHTFLYAAVLILIDLRPENSA